MEARLAAVEMRMDHLEDKMGRVEACLDRVDARLDGVDVRLRSVEQILANLSGKVEIIAAKLPSWWQMPAAVCAIIVIIGAAARLFGLH